MARSTASKKGTAVAVRTTGSALANIDAQLSQEAQGIMDQIGSPSSNAINVKGKVFTLPDGTVHPGPMNVVIVDFLSKNAYYDSKYDPKNLQPPKCFAIGRKIAELVPSPNSPEPQAKNCAECPMNQFGSDGDGKACKNTRVLAVLPPDADDETPLMTLGVSPTAIRGFDGYVATLAKMFQAPPIKFVTEVNFHPEKDHEQLLFGNPKPNPAFAEHFVRRSEANMMLTVEPDVSNYKATAKPKSTRRRA